MQKVKWLCCDQRCSEKLFKYFQRFRHR